MRVVKDLLNVVKSFFGTIYIMFKSKEIKNFEDLEEIREDPDGYYVLKSDIDASKTEEDDVRFNTIEDFQGVLDGRGHSIKHLEIENNDKETGVGIIEENNGTIRNLIIEDSSIVTNCSGVGLLIGILKEGSLVNCKAENCYVSGSDYVGGLVGDLNRIGKDNLVRDCEVDYMVVDGINNVGGIFGHSTYGRIEECKAKNSLVRGYDKVGSFMGTRTASKLDNCLVRNVDSHDSDNNGYFVGYCKTLSKPLGKTSTSINNTKVNFVWDLEEKGIKQIILNTE